MAKLIRQFFIFIVFSSLLSAYAVTPKNFNRVIKSNKLVLVKFWASWCPPCSVLNPEFKKAKKIIGKKALLVDYNVDLGGKVLDRYRVEYLPTMIIFKNGKEVERTNSVLNAQEIADWILKYK